MQLNDLLAHGVVGDLETTGIDPSRCSILQAGLISLRDPAIRLALDCRAWDGAQVDEAALAVNGFSRDRVYDRSLMPESDLVAKIADWVIEHDCVVLIGKSPGFDRGFLTAAWSRAGHDPRSFPLSHRSLDVHSVAVPILLAKGHRMPAAGFSSEQIRTLLGLPTEVRPHQAMRGAQVAYDSLTAIMLTLTSSLRGANGGTLS